ncbi:hypothetical protein LDENG_00086500 [Lucifuga dentata]|nr:hypothetical protein LDENG_00086500 [Lucifuga dentata]
MHLSPPDFIVAMHFIQASARVTFTDFSLQNAAARLLTPSRRNDHISLILADLHWLPVSFRIDFKVLLIVLKLCMIKNLLIYVIFIEDKSLMLGFSGI